MAEISVTDSERAIAAAAHGVNMMVDIDADLENLNLPCGLEKNIRLFLQKALDQHSNIGYMNALKQVKNMMEDAKVNVEALLSSTNVQLLATLDTYRQKAPYEMETVGQRI